MSPSGPKPKGKSDVARRAHASPEDCDIDDDVVDREPVVDDDSEDDRNEVADFSRLD